MLKADELNPNNLNINLNIGSLFFSAGEIDLALKYFDKVIKIKPDYVLAHFNKGIILNSQRKYQDAITCFEKIIEIRKYFLSTKKRESYDETLKILAEAKPATDNFFDNVIVNDENYSIKKNRLELLQLFCKTYNNFIDFSKVEGG